MTRLIRTLSVVPWTFVGINGVWLYWNLQQNLNGFVQTHRKLKENNRLSANGAYARKSHYWRREKLRKVLREAATWLEQHNLPTACRLFGLEIKSSITVRRCISEWVSLSKSNISTASASGRWLITNKDVTPVAGSRYTLIPWGLNPVRLKFFKVNSTGSSAGLLKSKVSNLPFRLSRSLSYMGVNW